MLYAGMPQEAPPRMREDWRELSVSAEVLKGLRKGRSAGSRLWGR